MSTKKRYRSVAESALWLSIVASGPSPGCDLSGVGIRTPHRELRFVLVLSVALMTVASLIWLL